MANKKKEAPAPKAGCDCADKIDELLASKNGVLLGAIPLSSGPRRVYVAVEKLDVTSRVKPPVLAVSYCPFCGAKAP